MRKPGAFRGEQTSDIRSIGDESGHAFRRDRLEGEIIPRVERGRYDSINWQVIGRFTEDRRSDESEREKESKEEPKPHQDQYEGAGLIERIGRSAQVPPLPVSG